MIYNRKSLLSIFIMFPFVNNLFRNDLPLFLFDDIFAPGPGIRVRVPRPPYTNRQFRD